MKIFKPIGSKERFLEMYQGVTKTQLNEVAANAVQTGTQLVEKAFEELKNKEAQVKQTNTQKVNNENFVEIITNDRDGNEITFTFKVNSNEGDQEGVYDVGGAVLTEFKIKSSTLNVEMPENMPAVQEFNTSYGDEIMNVITEYADFETDSVSVDDEMYEDAVKFIDKIPYKKGSEEIQTHKAYADQKPTNPELRVKNDELQKFVKEMQDFVDGTEKEDDLLALPTDNIGADIPQDDDNAIGVDPYDQIDVDDNGEEATPEQQELFSQAYDNLVTAGNQSPTVVDIENELNRLQGNTKPVEKTRAIPKGMEQFWENSTVHDINVHDVTKQGYDKFLSPDKKRELIFRAKELVDDDLGDTVNRIPKEMYKKAIKDEALLLYREETKRMNESTDQDRYEDVVFMQGEEANEPLEILNNQGEDAAMKYLQQWHSPGPHMGSAELGHGSSDQTYEKDGYVMAWNFPLNYIGLQYEVSGIDEETEKSDYPDQMGKKFKPKNQMPKKEKPQSVVKLGEEEEPEISTEPDFDAMGIGQDDEKPEDGDFIEGGKADDANVSEFNPQQIMIGIGVEMEHTDDPKVALEIAMGPLAEIPDYYTRLDKMEKEAGVEPEEETQEGLVDKTPEDVELTDELLGYKPHNVNDYTDEEFDYAAAEREYADKEDMEQNPEDYQSGEEQPEENISEEDGFEEYAGEIGDRYQDAENNQFTVRDKVKGGVTLQGQGGEKEIATNDIQFLKKLSEDEVVEMARQALNNRGLNEGMTKKEAVQVLIKHNIK